jgi:predicted ABC-type ATPase
MRLGNFITENVITESINDKGILKACFMAGNAGAGKSYTLSKITDGAIAPRVVNVDKWIEHFNAEYETPLHDKSKKLTRVDAYNYINSMLPLFVDSTSTNTNSTVRKMYMLHDLGYDTAMIFVNTSLETSLKRVEIRNKQINKKTGKPTRIVPLDKVEEYYYKAQQAKDFLKSKFEVYMEVNNNDGDLTDEVVLKAYNRMSFFFNSPVKNRKGNNIIETMTENGWKYLTDGIYSEEKLKKIISGWYRGIA